MAWCFKSILSIMHVIVLETEPGWWWWRTRCATIWQIWSNTLSLTTHVSPFNKKGLRCAKYEVLDQDWELFITALYYAKNRWQRPSVKCFKCHTQFYCTTCEGHRLPQKSLRCRNCLHTFLSYLLEGMISGSKYLYYLVFRTCLQFLFKSHCFWIILKNW